MTIPDRYPIPRIVDIVNKLTHSQWFTKLDIRWGYNNICIRPGDEWKAAFITEFGLFEPLVMFFGLCNSPATFQRMMNDIFKTQIEEGYVIVYLDDIVIHAPGTIEFHSQKVKQVLSILRQFRLYLKPEKCDFHKTEVEYLGRLVSHGMVKMDPTKVKAVTNWPIPNNKCNLQQFLGFTNYHRQFIKDYSKIARPLNNLIGKSPWTWSPAAQAAFDRLQQHLTSAKVLALPTIHGKFCIHSDASLIGSSAMLEQQQMNKWHPIAYTSKMFTPAEWNYSTSDRELLAIIHALKEWRHLLLTNPQTIEIWTDNNAITFFRRPQDLSYCHAQWAMTMADYNITIHYKKGTSNMAADGLSHQHDKSLAELDNKQIVLLPPKMFFDGPEEYKLWARSGLDVKIRRLHGELIQPSMTDNGLELFSVEDDILLAGESSIIDTGI